MLVPFFKPIIPKIDPNRVQMLIQFRQYGHHADDHYADNTCNPDNALH